MINQGDAIDARKAKRQRQDGTALHFAIVDATDTVAAKKLDVVCKTVSIQIPAAVTVDIERSLNGIDWTTIASAQTNATVTYGKGAAEHLVKWIRITRTAGAGNVTIAGTSA